MILSTTKSQPQLLVCTQKRSAHNPLCCANSGSEALLVELKRVASEHNLNIDILETKCMQLCEEGPNIRLNPVGKVWNQVSNHTIPEIMEACKKLAISP
jgi:NADH:ubiquinone oxidoreductase subunit E